MEIESLGKRGLTSVRDLDALRGRLTIGMEIDDALFSSTICFCKTKRIKGDRIDYL